MPGRLLGRDSCAAARYAIRLADDPPSPPATAGAIGARGTGRVVAPQRRLLRLLANLRDWTPEALWRAYIQLPEAEAAFRIHKSELSMPPSGVSAKIACWRISWVGRLNHSSFVSDSPPFE